MHLVGGGRAIVEGVDTPGWPKRRGQVQRQPSASCPRLPLSTSSTPSPNAPTCTRAHTPTHAHGGDGKWHVRCGRCCHRSASEDRHQTSSTDAPASRLSIIRMLHASLGYTGVPCLAMLSTKSSSVTRWIFSVAPACVLTLRMHSCAH